MRSRETCATCRRAHAGRRLLRRGIRRQEQRRLAGVSRRCQRPADQQRAGARPHRKQRDQRRFQPLCRRLVATEPALERGSRRCAATISRAIRMRSSSARRLNFSFRPNSESALHAGFARYLQVPSFLGIAPTTQSAFAGTTAAGPPGVTLPLAEDDYEYDAGVVREGERAPHVVGRQLLRADHSLSGYRTVRRRADIRAVQLWPRTRLGNGIGSTLQGERSCPLMRTSRSARIGSSRWRPVSSIFRRPNSPTSTHIRSCSTISRFTAPRRA